jgi:thiamine pyrophosphokinase
VIAKLLVFDYLIIAGGLRPPQNFLKKLLPLSYNLITVDSGVHAIKNFRIRPTLHVGDNDSAHESVIKKVRPKVRITLPQKKSVSDLEYTLQELPKNSMKLIVGAHRDHEGRPDHAFVNLLLASGCPQVFFVDETMWITSLKPKKLFEFSVIKSTLFSVVGFEKNRLTIKGSQYDIKNRPLKTPSMGLSNITKQKWVTVCARRPALLFVKASIFNSKLKM